MATQKKEKFQDSICPVWICVGGSSAWVGEEGLPWPNSNYNCEWSAFMSISQNFPPILRLNCVKFLMLWVFQRSKRQKYTCGPKADVWFPCLLNHSSSSNHLFLALICINHSNIVRYNSPYTLQCNTVHCTWQCNTVHCINHSIIVRCSAVQYNILYCSAKLHITHCASIRATSSAAILCTTCCALCNNIVQSRIWEEEECKLSIASN